MSKITSTAEASGIRADGRVARRERNQNRVLDVVLEMFSEDALLPTIEQVSKRSGLSLRTLYRYFADTGELLEAAIERKRGLNEAVAHLPNIGEGPLNQRVRDFTTMRLRVYEQTGAVHRASVHNAARHPRIAEALQDGRCRLRRQFERQFAKELKRLSGSERHHVLAAGDLLTQLDSIHMLRSYRQLTNAKTCDVLNTGLTALLG